MTEAGTVIANQNLPVMKCSNVGDIGKSFVIQDYEVQILMFHLKMTEIQKFSLSK